MRILALLYRDGEELYYGTIVELLLMEEHHEYLRVRWANYRGHLNRNDMILYKLIYITWDKKAKAGDLGSDMKTKLPHSRNEWFDGW